MTFNNKELALIDWIIKSNKDKKIVHIDKEEKKINYSNKLKFRECVR